MNVPSEVRRERSRLILSTIAAILFALFANLAHAKIVDVSWRNATADTDGVSLPTSGSGALASTVIEWGSCTSTGGFGTLAGTLTVPVTAPGDTQTAATQNLGVGVYCFRARHLTVDGTQSNWSGIVSITITTGKPRPPANLTLA
jgi:hypothetical protein